MVRSVRSGPGACLAALILLVFPLTAGAQTPTENTATQSASTAAPPDFLLGRPRAMIGVRGGLFLASANSDFFEDMTQFLTLEKSSFRTGTFSTELAVSLTPYLDIVGGLDGNRLSRLSEDREMEELLPNGTRVPIQQTTELSEMNFTASAKLSLLSRGRRVSRLAWIPRTVIPYIGAGAGYGKYSLRQNGDFADQGNLNVRGDETVFSDSFRSEGWAPVFHAFGGTDVQLYRRLMLSLEGRYTWKKADLSADYVGYEPIDLGGFRLGAGIHFSF
jgi:opacity protein-like surface antigen